MEYSINKGIGETVEYKGLKAQYLFIFAAGLLALFVLFVVMYMCGVPQWFCIGFGAVSATALVAATNSAKRIFLFVIICLVFVWRSKIAPPRIFGWIQW